MPNLTTPNLMSASTAAPNPFPQPTGDMGAMGAGMGGTSTPGANAITQGYNTGYNNLLQALGQAGNTTSGQMMGLNQQLQNNQANVRQGLTNAGLGNSTIMQSAEQAPLQTYNLGAANVQNQGALLNMGAYQNLANMAAQGGNTLAGYYSPFGQQGAQQNLQQAMMNQGVIQATGANNLGQGGGLINGYNGGGGGTADYAGTDAQGKPVNGFDPYATSYNGPSASDQSNLANLVQANMLNMPPTDSASAFTDENGQIQYPY